MTNALAAATPFDLGSRVGSSAFAQACAPLDTIWEGDIDKFPAFIIGLRVCAQKARWNATAPQGILTYSIDGKDSHLRYLPRESVLLSKLVKRATA